jgi:hypothetical protein
MRVSNRSKFVRQPLQGLFWVLFPVGTNSNRVHRDNRVASGFLQGTSGKPRTMESYIPLCQRTPIFCIEFPACLFSMLALMAFRFALLLT